MFKNVSLQHQGVLTQYVRCSAIADMWMQNNISIILISRTVIFQLFLFIFACLTKLFQADGLTHQQTSGQTHPLIMFITFHVVLTMFCISQDARDCSEEEAEKSKKLHRHDQQRRTFIFLFEVILKGAACSLLSRIVFDV